MEKVAGVRLADAVVSEDTVVVHIVDTAIAPTAMINTVVSPYNSALFARRVDTVVMLLSMSLLLRDLFLLSLFGIFPI